MKTPLRIPVLIFLLLLPVTAQEKAPSLAQRLEKRVAALCAPEMVGRFGDGAEQARLWLEKEFRRLDLDPLGESYRMSFAASGMKGVNLVGVLRAGAKEKLPGHLIISAHYDHLGKRGEVVFPGACDNASGVAAMLEVVASLDAKTLRRDVVVVAFDLEERGLLGSFAYAEKPPLPLADCHLFITMDMLGRKGLGLLKGVTFAQGWEWTPELLPDLEAAFGHDDLDLRCFWTDIAGNRSDFVAFKKKRVPHLFFSTGENEDYHQRTDLPERLDHELLALQTEAIGKFLARVLAREKQLACLKEPKKDLVEFRSIDAIAGALFKSKDERILPAMKRDLLMLQNFARQVIARAQVRDEDRAFLRRAARQLQRSMR